MGQYWGMRIVSLLPSATEIVYALGLEGHLVGVTDECDWPPQARTVQVVSRSALVAAAEPAKIDRLVSASIGGGQPLYRLASAFHEVLVADAAGYARSPPEQGECGCLKVAVPAQGGHLAGAGYQLAVPVRSHHRRRRGGRPCWGGAAAGAG